jgi:hypothetical protein
MMSKVNCIDSPRRPDPEWDHSRDAAKAGNDDGYQAMVEQGLRLNQAFIRIKDPFVREAIVHLVVEAAKNKSEAEILTAAQRLFRYRPAEAQLVREEAPELRPSTSAAQTRRPPRM